MENENDMYKGDFEWLGASVILGITSAVLFFLEQLIPFVIFGIAAFITLVVFDIRITGTGDGSTPTEYGA